VEESPASKQPYPHRDLVVMGASAGGVETLKCVVGGLPADLPASVCVVLHIAPTSPSALAHILQRAGPLPCRAACDGDLLRRGEILVAPPDRHLVIEDGRVRLTVGPRENGHRPAVDVLFRSAAAERQAAVVGVVLSGTRDDGAAGLAAIKSQGGAAVVQDPDEALYSAMPANALAHVAVDAVVPSARIAQTVAAIVRGEYVPGDPDPAGSAQPRDREDRLTIVCPDCGGVLTEGHQPGMLQWKCHVGHRYSPRSLADAQGARVEEALWTAVRMLRDRGALLERMADDADGRMQPRSARRFRTQAQEARDQAEQVLAAQQAAAATLLTGSGDEDYKAVGVESTDEHGV
jgi:two-component system chemotaxis response regulator CheB